MTKTQIGPETGDEQQTTTNPNTPHVVRCGGHRLCYLADPQLYTGQHTVTAFDERGYAHIWRSKAEADAWIEARRQEGATLTLWSEPVSGGASASIVPKAPAPPVIVEAEADEPPSTERAPHLGAAGWNRVAQLLDVDAHQPALDLSRPDAEIDREHERLVRQEVLRRARVAGRTEAQIDLAIEAVTAEVAS